MNFVKKNILLKYFTEVFSIKMNTVYKKNLRYLNQLVSCNNFFSVTQEKT